MSPTPGNTKLQVRALGGCSGAQGQTDHHDVVLSEAQKKENHKLCDRVSRRWHD
jgi:hypothetical protein